MQCSMEYSVRNVKRCEIGGICRWRNECFGYKAHEQYLTTLFDCDPSGWFVAVDKKSAKVIGLIVCSKINEKFMFMGLWAVEEEFRRCGVGMTLSHKSLSRLKDEVLALNAIESRVLPNIKLGLQPSFKMIKYSGYIDSVMLNTFKALSNHTTWETDDLFEVINLSDIFLKMKFIDKIIAYDTEIETINRSFFMTQIILHMDGCKTYIALSRDVNKNDIIGYGILRPLTKGYNIGPIFANNTIVAHKLLSQMLNSLSLEGVNIIEILLPQPSETSDIEIIESKNDVFNSLISCLNINATFYRMYSKGYVCNLSLSKVYAMTGTESFLL